MACITCQVVEGAINIIKMVALRQQAGPAGLSSRDGPGTHQPSDAAGTRRHLLQPRHSVQRLTLLPAPVCTPGLQHRVGEAAFRAGRLPGWHVCHPSHGRGRARNGRNGGGIQRECRARGLASGPPRTAGIESDTGLYVTKLVSRSFCPVGPGYYPASLQTNW